MKLFNIKTGDFNGFWALLADNLANIIILSGVMTFVYHMPKHVVFGRIVPGVAVSILLGLGFYCWQARRLQRMTNRTDVTALPYGLSTPVLFVYLFAVIGPVYFHTKNGILAWQVGMAAAFIGGVIETIGSLIGPWVKKHTPRAAMLGTLAGIAFVWIAVVPLAEIFETPIVGLPALMIILIGLLAQIKLPFGIPAGLLAIIVGSTIYHVTTKQSFVVQPPDLHIPVVLLGDLIAGFKAIWNHSGILAVVLPIEIYNTIETMNNVESAEAAGDAYNVRTAQIADGVGTIIGSLFGSAFPTTVYIGHPGYKRLGARTDYGFLVGLFIFIAALTGIIQMLYELIPIAAVAPILVYIGIIIVSQAYQASPKRHMIAVTIAMLPHVSNLLHTKAQSIVKSIASAHKIETHGPLKAYQSFFTTNGIHWIGHEALSQGAIVTGLLWGAIMAFLLDKQFYRACIAIFIAMLASICGLMHGPMLGFSLNSIAIAYSICFIIILGVAIFNTKKYEK